MSSSSATVFECFASSERAQKAISRIQIKKYDVDSWNVLIKESANKNIDEVEPFYEELLKTFPLCGRFWKAYVEHEMRFKRYDKVSKLFQRSLEEVLSIDLYKCYLNYVKEAKANEPDLLYKAFRYTLDKVSIDPNAITIYNDYIQFLKDREVDSSYLDSQKITAVRKAYQEGVMNPMFHIENLWKDYINYEQGNNPMIAEKMVQDRSRDHMNTRRVAKELEVTIRGLNRSWPAVPPTFSVEEARQLEIWRKYIQWEKTNPLRTENSLVVLKRVCYAYKQCILCFGHHPNFWLEYANYLDELIKSLGEKDPELGRRLVREQQVMFDRATRGLMRHNYLIHFAYADFEESRNDKRKALEIYNNLIEIGHDNPQIDLTLVYVQLMRFTRRTEGIKSARAVFKRAREESQVGHQIYTAAALMEYHCTKDQGIACKIFEIGLKKFNNCPDLILSYVHFMTSLNEENNTRVLFERILTTSSLQPKDTVEIWNAFLESESSIGDLSSITKVERRRMAALEKLLPKCTDASWAVDKYKFQDLFPCSLNELRSLGYDPQQFSTTSASITSILQAIGQSAGSASNQQVNGGGNSSGSRRTKMTGRNQMGKLPNGDLNDAVDSDTEFSLMALNQTGVCYPDLDQMIPFKPVMTPGFGAHTVPGGVFPPPPAVGNLLGRLPPQGSFWGPFVDVEELCNYVTMSDFDELYNNLEQKRNDASMIKSRTKRARTE